MSHGSTAKPIAAIVGAGRTKFGELWYDNPEKLLFEAALTGMVGGVLGAGSRFVLGDLVGTYVGISATPTITLALMVVGFAVVTSVVSGLYPSWSASQLSPVEALRHE
jgi:ABC-type antimicrobial peptide transport system permease subunit